MAARLSSFMDSRDNNFNLIRFVAATLVLITHSFAIVTGSGEMEPLRQSLGMSWGVIAVDVFFLTSGFLIAASFLNRKSLFGFVWARFLRIYPALFVAVFFCTFIVGLSFTTLSKFDYLTDLNVYKYFIKNITLFFGASFRLPEVFVNLPLQGGINGSLWTLPYEVKMYACLVMLGLPLLFMQSKLKQEIVKPAFIILAFVSLNLNIYSHFYLELSDHFIPLFTAFFVGSAIYVCREHILLTKKIFLSMAAALILSIANKDIFFIVYSLALPYLIIYLAYITKDVLLKFNKFGDYSYGIYIYAFPIQQVVVRSIPDISILDMILLSFLITFIFAYTSWHIIEKRALKIKNTPPKFIKHAHSLALSTYRAAFQRSQ